MVIYEGNRFVTNCRPGMLAAYLNQLSPVYKGVVNLYEGKSHHIINAVVARELAFQFLTFGSCDVQVMGEALIAENENDFIDIFRRLKTERLILKGAYIQSTAESIETAFRKIAYE
ncbi:hypothetical protein BN79_184 [Yersinia phage phiR2-01]|uniref:DNA-(apurinic or apyrimidinic site) endonuclease n=1 Tax=Yersinia phage phiR2-01 TaxID=1206557 RepID=A0A140KXY1_9CAUD|nr:hypothetical protein BN79_168 [Yersinia phage phiR2-01]YP_009237930.1 hypothetical protein BN79_184 [Yersinia phage phiR2-01]CZT05355.1 hypothetical protein BN79_168 [Yersinia phage phiR2-01]CZT05380.1 hypothetical protein BN79_184 [Yersinia phage phiR2-01]